MLRFSLLLVVALTACELAQDCYGQHCPPIGSSYLSEISLKSHKQGELTLRVEHIKTGGRLKESYQFYLLAYLAKDSKTLPTPPEEGQKSRYGDEMFTEATSVVLDTSVVKRTADGYYKYSVTKNSAELAEELKSKLLEKSKKTVDGGWGRFEDRIRLAIFVPFLEDERYANLEGLPENRHECNYSGDRALVWQELPYNLSVHFYDFDTELLKKKAPYIQINGDQRKAPSY